MGSCGPCRAFPLPPCSLTILLKENVQHYQHFLLVKQICFSTGCYYLGTQGV